MRLLSPVFAAVLVVLSASSEAQNPAPLPVETTTQPEAPAPSDGREAEWYGAEVPVTSQERREREAALGRALAQVAIRMSGRADAPSNPVVQKATRVAESMVLSADYRQIEETAGGVPVQRTVLAVRFDPDAIDALVMAAGLPLWSGPRSKPMLWFAIDDGSGGGARLVSAQQINVVKPLAQRGLERGLRFLLPSGTSVEQPAATSIWALDAAAVGVLTSRYGGRLQLLGKMSRGATGGWTAEWLLADGESELRRWSSTDPSPQRVIASGADTAADVLAQRSAVVVPAGEPVVLDAEISNIRNQDDWLALAAYLQSIPVLRGFEIIEAQPNALRVRLDLAIGRERFDAMLVGGRLLVPVESAAAVDGPSRYRLAR
jgi:hypothetical protein